MIEFAGWTIIVLAWLVIFAGLMARAIRTGKIQDQDSRG